MAIQQFTGRVKIENGFVKFKRHDGKWMSVEHKERVTCHRGKRGKEYEVYYSRGIDEIIFYIENDSLEILDPWFTVDLIGIVKMELIVYPSGVEIKQIIKMKGGTCNIF